MKNVYSFRKTTGLLLMLLLNIMMINGQNVEVVANGLNGVNGLSLDANGNLWITEAGTGNNDAKVSVMTPDKVIYPAIANLPSFFDTMEGDAPGAWKAYHNGNKLDVIVGGGPNPNAGSLISFDLSGWKPGDAPLKINNAIDITHINSFLNTKGLTDSDPYRVVWDADGNAIIVDAAANSILKKDAKTGLLSILHTFPPYANTFTPFPPFIDYVPTGIVKNPAGGYYICNLTGFPFIPGLASIVKMDDNGNVTPFVNNLTMLDDLDIDPKGNLFALQLGQFDTAFNPVPFAAKVIRITPMGETSVYASAYTPVLSSGIVLDGNGGFYANDLGLGQILHVSFPSATNDLNNADNINMNLAPNPINSSTQLSFELSKESKVNISILDMMGHNIIEMSFGNLSQGKHSTSINMTDVAAGQYVVSLKTNTCYTTQKIVKL